VDVLLVNEALETMQGEEQPGPEIETSAVAGSKPVPLMVNVNDCAAIGGFGVVEMLLREGPPPLAVVTVSATPLDAVPLAPF